MPRPRTLADAQAARVRPAGAQYVCWRRSDPPARASRGSAGMPTLARADRLPDSCAAATGRHTQHSACVVQALHSGNAASKCFHRAPVVKPQLTGTGARSKHGTSPQQSCSAAGRHSDPATDAAQHAQEPSPHPALSPSPAQRPRSTPGHHAPAVQESPNVAQQAFELAVSDLHISHLRLPAIKTIHPTALPAP